jgi:hypothetical protein
MCKPCADKQEAAMNDALDLSAAVAAEAQAEAIELPKDQACAKCGGFMETGQRLCTRCGYDRVKGVKVSTRVEAVKAEKAERSNVPLDLSWLTVLVAAVCSIAALAGAFAPYYAPDMKLEGIIAFAAVAIITSILVIVLQFKDGDTWWGVGTILSFFLPFFGWATLYWTFANNDRGWLKLLYTCVTIGGLAVMLERWRDIANS